MGRAESVPVRACQCPWRGVSSRAPFFGRGRNALHGAGMNVIAKCALLLLFTLLFFGGLAFYGLILLPALMSYAEAHLGADIRGDTPMLDAIFGVGPALAFGGLLVWGVINVISQRGFFNGVEWPKIGIVMLCYAMFQGLTSEAEALFPASAGDPLLFFCFVGVIYLGYRLWPKRPTRYRCPACGNWNPTDVRQRCLNPECGQFRSAPVQDEDDVPPKRLE